jgi:hypothetical protein
VSRLTTGVGKMVDKAADDDETRKLRVREVEEAYSKLADIAFRYEVWNGEVDRRLVALEKREKATVELLKELREKIGEAADGAKELKEIGLELRGFHVKMTAEMSGVSERVKRLDKEMAGVVERVQALEGKKGV